MKLILGLLLGLITSNTSFGNEEKPEWFQCQNDKECVDIAYPCSGHAVNKKFAKEANEFYRQQNAVRECAVKVPSKNLPPFKVFCKKSKCESQGRNPKIGFS